MNTEDGDYSNLNFQDLSDFQDLPDPLDALPPYNESRAGDGWDWLRPPAYLGQPRHGLPSAVSVAL